MRFLPAILQAKRKEVARAKAMTPRASFEQSFWYARPCRSLMSALTEKGFSVIAEVKKASPSKGVLREHFDPVAIAQSYERGGAAALSVLTDEEFFQGSLDSLRMIRKASTLPLLRKDFIIDEYQLHEAKAAGADAVLLIVAALGAESLRHLSMGAAALGLECLIEVHTAAELAQAKDAGAMLIGINNRNLDTFETDIMTSVRLAAGLPPGGIGIGESGISTPADLDLLKQAGLRAALVGESLVRAQDPGRALASLMEGMML